jgi:hypothetical protein
MKTQIDKTLRDYLDEAYCCVRLGRHGATRYGKAVLDKALGHLESQGDAMRYLDAKGRVAWKATPRLQSYLDDLRADAEAEAEEEAI